MEIMRAFALKVEVEKGLFQLFSIAHVHIFYLFFTAHLMGFSILSSRIEYFVPLSFAHRIFDPFFSSCICLGFPSFVCKQIRSLHFRP